MASDAATAARTARHAGTGSSRSPITTVALGALFLTRVLESLLDGVETLDPTTFVGMSVVILAVAFLGSYIPARRTWSVDPMQSLRMEQVPLHPHRPRGPGYRTPRSRPGAAAIARLTAVMLVGGCNPEAEDARVLRASCEEGDAAACQALALLTQEGDHVLRDWRRAAELYDRACQGGEAQGCIRLARLHVHDQSARRGVPHDSAHAAELLRRGCSDGAAAGCVDLAEMYLEPDSLVPDVEATGPLQDFREAAALLDQACQGGEMGGCTRLGLLYGAGQGVDADPIRAAALHRTACDGGSLLGCANLGLAYQEGRGVEPDPERAATLYQTACEGEALEPLGCLRLAELHLQGLGVEQDPNRAMELFDEGCYPPRREGGSTPPLDRACFRAGEMYANGTGVARDVYQAGRYFRRACTLGYADACRR